MNIKEKVVKMLYMTKRREIDIAHKAIDLMQRHELPKEIAVRVLDIDLSNKQYYRVITTIEKEIKILNH